MAEKIAPYDKCPHCGSDDGFYTKLSVRGSTEYFYNFDGSDAGNGEMYDNPNLTFEHSKYAYCIKCSKRLFKMP